MRSRQKSNRSEVYTPRNKMDIHRFDEAEFRRAEHRAKNGDESEIDKLIRSED